MKIDAIKGMSMKEIRNTFSEGDLKSMYTNLRRSVTQRAHAFERRGMRPNIPAGLRGLKPASEVSASAMLDALSQASNSYYKSDLYTASGFQRIEAERRSELAEKLGMSSMSEEQYGRYKMFMNDVNRMMKGAAGLVSSQAQQLFAEAERLNMNAYQFMKNFDYWSKHVKDLQNAKPIVRSSKVRPSDYIRQLKMETITSWRTKNK